MQAIFPRSPRANPGAAADAAPAPDTAPAPKQEEKRWFSLRGGERAKQFALSLKANAQWMHRFLHGGK